jgi:hypothetical protein
MAPAATGDATEVPESVRQPPFVCDPATFEPNAVISKVTYRKTGKPSPKQKRVTETHTETKKKSTASSTKVKEAGTVSNGVRFDATIALRNLP